MPATKVAIIVLNYRGKHVLRRCLASLEKAIERDDAILVVDNGDEMPLLVEMEREFPRIQTVSAGLNRGFARGMNFGIRRFLAQGNFNAFWLMNNDASVDPGALGALKQALLEKGAHALYSPLIFSDPARAPWFSGGKINFFRMRTQHAHAFPETSNPYETGFLTGCALFLPTQAIKKIGLLDERYFLYYEDAEYSIRAFRKGLKLWMVPRSRVVHTEESRQNPAKAYWLVRSGAEFFLRESRGIWRLWITLYFPLRRLKNWFAARDGETMANEVKRAYTDVSL